MFARLTLLEVDTMRTSMDTAVDRFCVEVLPQLQRQEGYNGVLVLTTGGGK